jgi:hypothetical protein
MKTQIQIFIAIFIFLSLFSCGPTDYEKHQAQLQQQRDSVASIETDIQEGISEIHSYQAKVMKSLIPIGDTTVKFQDGMVSVPDGEVWLIKQRILMGADSILPPVVCECPPYQKSSNDPTTAYDAVVNGRCTKFAGFFELTGGGHTNSRVLNVKIPSNLPPFSNVTAMKNIVLVIQRNRINDIATMKQVKKIIDRVLVTDKNQSLKDYFYVHCFNDEHETRPLKFAVCDEMND